MCAVGLPWRAAYLVGLAALVSCVERQGGSERDPVSSGAHAATETATPSTSAASRPCETLAGRRLDALDASDADGCSYGPIGPVACDRYLTFEAAPSGLRFRFEDDRDRVHVAGTCACEAALLRCTVEPPAPGFEAPIEARWSATRRVLLWRRSPYGERPSHGAAERLQ
ncbi:MAG: hypothetical protein IT373_02485 [Polyangiaceae bacterium]|nr:hypothetical protein [Polyangiaceae bacterium]